MNKVTLMGRLTKDIELKYSNNNVAVVSFALAVNRKFVKEGEERQADFISCKAFAKTAEFLEKWFKKGSMLAIVGRIQTGSYEKDGVKHYTTDVIVEDTYFCGSKNSDGGSSENNNSQPGFSPMDDGSDELPF